MLIHVNNISKTYSKKRVLNNINFSIGRGEIVGLIGPNGSGKTTLLNILMGMLRPNTGTIDTVDDCRTGMAVSRKGFFDDMSTTKNIYLYTDLLDMDRSDVLKVMDDFLIDFHSEKYGKLSAGMKQKVSLVLPFLSYHDLIILDEPTNHLDIDSILNLRSTILNKTKENGTSFLITSHIFSDLEKMCDRIIFLKKGEIVMEEFSNVLIENYGSFEEAYLQIKE